MFEVRIIHTDAGIGLHLEGATFDVDSGGRVSVLFTPDEWERVTREVDAEEAAASGDFETDDHEDAHTTEAWLDSDPIDVRDER